ncbi:hypothetical protein [Pseudomonas sp. Hp2]|uniref:outer membrane lipoprotein n=1 Tax=Pseudomonas sp. Hp2 TaxID=701189 RepID=UPI00112C496D|nr:hypothetical protein [Pseudomonas sp. Hp2]
MRSVAAPVVIAALLGACAPNVRTDSYSVGSVGQVNRTVAGTVISVRPVSIDGSQGGGAMAGAAAGGVAGSAVGGSDRANAIGAIGGVVVGAIAGAAMERGASKAAGLEYVVQTENGNLMTIVQGAEPMFPAGAKVLVLYGSPSRVIADPRAR